MKKFDLVQYQQNVQPNHRRFGVIVTDPFELPYIPDHAGASPGTYNVLNEKSYDMFHAVIVMDVITHEHHIVNPSNLYKYEFDFYDSYLFSDHIAPLRTCANSIEKLLETLVAQYHNRAK